MREPRLTLSLTLEQARVLSNLVGETTDHPDALATLTPRDQEAATALADRISRLYGRLIHRLRDYYRPENS